MHMAALLAGLIEIAWWMALWLVAAGCWGLPVCEPSAPHALLWAPWMFGRQQRTCHACRYGSHVDWIPLEPWQTAVNNPLEWSFSPPKALMMCCPEIEFAKCHSRDIYTGINHTDIYLKQSQMTPDLPDPIGMEIAGVEGKAAQKAAHEQVNAAQQAAQQSATNQEAGAAEQVAQTVVQRHQQPVETSDDDVAEV